VWGNEWDEEYKTILPGDIAAAAHDAYETCPNKRLIVHFMQPHVPFIGDLGREIEQHGILGDDEENPESGTTSEKVPSIHGLPARHTAKISNWYSPTSRNSYES